MRQLLSAVARGPPAPRRAIGASTSAMPSSVAQKYTIGEASSSPTACLSQSV